MKNNDSIIEEKNRIDIDFLFDPHGLYQEGILHYTISCGFQNQRKRTPETQRRVNLKRSHVKCATKRQ